MTNYIDFNLALRKKEHFKSLIYNNLQELNHRNIVNWVDIDKLWDDHLSYAKNYGNALTLLASLEMNFKMQD